MTARELPVYEEARERSFCLAVAGGDGVVDLAGADELFVVWHRLAQSPRVLASDERGLRVCR